ncbi:MAG: hypothetical protein HUJ94_01510, partial [Bacteroidales bacterium]|nr:hypothetical protein [Bacteroidales bacterium]
MMLFFKKLSSAAVALAAMAAVFVSCGMLEKHSQDISVSVKSVQVSGTAGNQFLSIAAEDAWTLSVSAEGTGDEGCWAWFKDFFSD